MIGADTIIDPSDERLTFAAPWNARAFALVIALSERDFFTLKDFQAELIATIGNHEKTGCITTEEEYYTHWIEALTALLKRRDLLTAEAIAAVEDKLLAAAASIREHQHVAAHGTDGRLLVQPLSVMPGNV